MTDLPPLSDARVRAALRRAAQLQVEATERLEAQARARVEALPATDRETDGFQRDDVVAAAVEAGIAREHIRQALLEQEALGGQVEEISPWVDRMGVRMLRTSERGLRVSRTIAAEPRIVLSAIHRALTEPPFDLTLLDSVGGDPLDGGILVYRVPDLMALATSSSSSPSGFAVSASAVDVNQILLSLQPLERDGRTGCEVALSADLRRSVRRNVKFGLASAGVLGGVGAAAGVVVGIATGALVPLTAVYGLAGLTGLGGATAVGYGPLYRYYLRKVKQDLADVLRGVDVQARTALLNPGTPPPPRPDEGR